MKLYEFIFYHDNEQGFIFVIAKSKTSALRIANEKLILEDFNKTSHKNLVQSDLEVLATKEGIFEVIYP